MIAPVYQKKFSINFSKATTKFWLILDSSGDQNDLCVNKTEICKFKTNDNITWYDFCLGIISDNFTKAEQKEISLNGTAYNFSLDQSSIKKDYILNIIEYLMVQNNIK